MPHIPRSMQKMKIVPRLVAAMPINGSRKKLLENFNRSRESKASLVR